MTVAGVTPCFGLGCREQPGSLRLFAFKPDQVALDPSPHVCFGCSAFAGSHEPRGSIGACDSHHVRCCQTISLMSWVNFLAEKLCYSTVSSQYGTTCSTTSSRLCRCTSQHSRGLSFEPRGLPRACDGDAAHDIRRTAMYVAFQAVSSAIATRHDDGLRDGQ